MSLSRFSGAGLQIAQQSSSNSLALTATPVQFSLFSTIGSNCPGNADAGSDFGVKADKANNRLVVTAPGIYRVSFYATHTQSVAGIVTGRFRKKGVALTTAPRGRQTCTTGVNQLVMCAEIAVTEADIAAGDGVLAFPAPAGGGVVGELTGAPKTGVGIDVDLAVSADGNFVVTDARLYAERIG